MAVNLKWVNCVECNSEVLGESMVGWYSKLSDSEKAKYSIVVGRIHGRPYCNRCCATEIDCIEGLPEVVEDSNPWQENAIRQLEDTRDLGEDWE